ncbi:trehalose-phosphatase [bacterium]|nr:MAG: trehalose-phosphatase [bacterium]
MKSLSLNHKNILSRISKTDKLLIFLDYDGTLAPISNRPELALMPNKTRLALKQLIKNKRITVSIISGRVLRNVKKLVNVNGIYYAGCHGLEIEGLGSVGPVSRLEKYRIFIKQAKRLLVKQLMNVISLKAVDIEDKGVVLSLHYRRVKERYLKDLKRIFYGITEPYVVSGGMVVIKNKKVLELRPDIEWDKGMYCLYMLRRLGKKGQKTLPIYIGDDKTDETAFKVLKENGITIFVRGERKTSLAEYYADSTNEVKNFLQLIAESAKKTD